MKLSQSPLSDSLLRNQNTQWTVALTAGISSSPSFIPQANAADDEAAAVWMDEAEATMRREYLPRLVQFGLPEDAACFEGELAGLLFFGFLAFHWLLSLLTVYSYLPSRRVRYRLRQGGRARLRGGCRDQRRVRRHGAPR